MRGQPKAGLRIAKWDRVVNWKFRGISDRASHLLGLTDLGQKWRGEKTPILNQRYFFESIQCRLLFPLAYHLISKSNQRCVGTWAEEVRAAIHFPFHNRAREKSSANVHCTAEQHELVPSAAPAITKAPQSRPSTTPVLERLPRQASSVRGLRVRGATSTPPNPSSPKFSFWQH